MLSHLSLADLHRAGATNVGSVGGSQTERFSFDFVIDGESLYRRLDAGARDLIGALGWLPDDGNRRLIDQLLLEADSPVAGGRRMLFICPECGDLGCGAITCEVTQEGSTIVWRHFGYENDYDPVVRDLAEFASVGPFHFDVDEYRTALERANRASAA